MSETKKEFSPLVQTVMALDSYFAELDRLGGKINTMDLKTDFDFEHARRLMGRFAECGQGVSEEVTKLSNYLLTELRAKAGRGRKAVVSEARRDFEFSEKRRK